jgi:Reverse transcriptase (RNA-dependent DNA polymerase)
MGPSTASTAQQSNQPDRAPEAIGEEQLDALRPFGLETDLEEDWRTGKLCPTPVSFCEPATARDSVDCAVASAISKHCHLNGRVIRGKRGELYTTLRSLVPDLTDATDQRIQKFLVEWKGKGNLTSPAPEPPPRRTADSLTSAPIPKRRKATLLDEATRQSATGNPTHTIPAISMDELSDKVNHEKEAIDAHRIKKVTLAYQEALKEVKNTQFAERGPTFGFTYQSQRKDLIEELDIQIGKHLEKLEDSKELNIDTLADAIYAVQMAYQTLTEKRRTKIDYTRPLNDKIQANEALIELIDRKRSNQKVSKKEKHTLRQIAMKKDRDPDRDLQLDIVREQLSQENDSIRNRIRLAEKRKEFSRQNYLFTVKRAAFYREQEDKNIVGEELAGKENEVLDFWKDQWSRPESSQAFSSLLNFTVESREAAELEIPKERWTSIIKQLPDWKAAGPCRIHNFFIKNLPSAHNSIISVLTDLMRCPEKIPDWFYSGNTFLIPKKAVATDPSHFRPITCMSNLYKLFTKALTQELTEYVEAMGILSINQMGTVRGAQGAKEQALFNRAINNQHENELYTAWIDVQKAFDSVDHEYLIALLDHLRIPDTVKRFIKIAIKKWRLNLFHQGKPLGTAKMEKGILQGDSLSPLLFVLVMEPLSRVLEDGNLPRIQIRTKTDEKDLNHLLFIDDIKLYARIKADLERLLEATVNVLQAIGLRINVAKSATNYETDSPHAQEIGKDGSYKYLGVHEDCDNRISSKTKQGIQDEMLNRIRKLCTTSLSSRNLFQAINEYALSVLNYHIALVDYTQEEFEELDRKVRTLLRSHRIHYKPASWERLYLARKENGRGLANIEHKAERLTMSFSQYLGSAPSNIRKGVIWEMEVKESSPTAHISQLLVAKYPVLKDQPLAVKSLKAAQTKALLDRNSGKVLHSKFFTYKTDILISQKDSPKWLRTGLSSPQEEGRYMFLQDRNVYYESIQTCVFCKVPRTLEHVASSCTLKLPEYTFRHNEILKCIHKCQVNRYGFSKDKRVKRHRIDRVIKNAYAEISTDVKIETERPISENRPDLVIKDIKKRMIYIVDVAVSHRNGITPKEHEKTAKYEKVRRELAQRTGYQAIVLPYVISWDGNVSKENGKIRNILGISDEIHSYIQKVALRETVDIVCRDISAETDSLVKRLSEDKVDRVLSSYLEGGSQEEDEVQREATPLISP